MRLHFEQLRWACEAGLPRGVVLLDAGYGNNSELRAHISKLGLCYVAGILSNTTVWAPGTGPLPAKEWSGRGRPTKLLRRVRAARRDFKRSESRPEEWLLIEWPKGEKEPTKYWRSNAPAEITLQRLVYIAKLRWRSIK